MRHIPWHTPFYTAHTDCRSLHSGQTVIGLLAHQPRILQILLLSIGVSRYLSIAVSQYRDVDVVATTECCSLARKQSWHLSPCVGAAYAKLFMKTEPGSKKNKRIESLSLAIEVRNTLVIGTFYELLWFSISKS